MVAVSTAVYIDGFNFYYGAARPLHVARVDGAVPVGLINPQPGKRSQQLAAEASFTKEIRRADLFASLLPDRIANEGGEILRPSDW
jgi:hypothetical protein